MLEKNLHNSEKQEDQFLLKQIGQGCKQSFNQLYEKHWEHAYESAFKRLKNSEEAKDIVQEIFTHIWLKREILTIDNLPAYISVAVRNRIFKFISKQKTSHPFFDVLENIPGMYMEADANLLTKEFFQAYEAVINSLPAKKQMIFRLRFQEDLSTKDISKHLGLSIKTVQNQIGKAIEQLRITFFLLLIILLSLFSA
ncbi:MAG: sigma-70 family polymerase sigma factor [Segetibacter sp.]|nr:sigma-70 family polymerase sigma factor [Segetibacter sp.]